MDTARPCLTRFTVEVLSRPGKPCRFTVPKKVLEKEPKRTVCTPCRDKLILQYQRMAYLFANREWLRNRLFRRRLERDDLSQIALLGLTKCAARYDPDKGKLSTILPYWVKAELQSAVIHHGGAVCLPLWATRGGPIDDEQVKRAMADKVCLDDLPGGRLRVETAKEYEPSNPNYAALEEEVLRGTSTDCREKDILLMNVVGDMSHNHIGEQLGRTKERIRQIKNRAVRKIRENLSKRGISA